MTPPTRASWALVTTQTGFTLGGVEICWASIEQVRAFKLDLLTTDEVRFVFVLSSGSTFEISEEQPGFEMVLTEAKHQFPSLADWQSKIIKPAFGFKETTLFQRPVQPGSRPEQRETPRAPGG